MTLNLTVEQVLAGLGVVLVVAWVWRAGSRRARRAADAVRAGGRVVSLVGRVTLMAAGFVGVQWLVITQIDNVTLLLVVLAMPDLVAAHVLTRMLTVTEVGTTRRRGSPMTTRHTGCDADWARVAASGRSSSPGAEHARPTPPTGCSQRLSSRLTAALNAETACNDTGGRARP